MGPLDIREEPPILITAIIRFLTEIWNSHDCVSSEFADHCIPRITSLVTCLVTNSLSGIVKCSFYTIGTEDCNRKHRGNITVSRKIPYFTCITLSLTAPCYPLYLTALGLICPIKIGLICRRAVSCGPL